MADDSRKVLLQFGARVDKSVKEALNAVVAPINELTRAMNDQMTTLNKNMKALSNMVTGMESLNKATKKTAAASDMAVTSLKKQKKATEDLAKAQDSYKASVVAGEGPVQKALAMMNAEASRLAKKESKIFAERAANYQKMVAGTKKAEAAKKAQYEKDFAALVKQEEKENREYEKAFAELVKADKKDKAARERAYEKAFNALVKEEAAAEKRDDTLFRNRYKALLQEQQKHENERNRKIKAEEARQARFRKEEGELSSSLTAAAGDISLYNKIAEAQNKLFNKGITVATLDQRAAAYSRITSEIKQLTAATRLYNQVEAVAARYGIDVNTLGDERARATAAYRAAKQGKASEIAYLRDAKAQMGLPINGITTFGDRIVKTMTSLASYTVAGGVLYTLINGFQSAVSSVAEFDQALKNLQAITQASQTDIKLLGDEIVRVSTRTKYNLAEVAEGATIIGQAGYSASETMSILGATMELAQGTMSSTATSADLLTTTLQAFRMEAKDAGLAADVMAVAVNKSKLDIDKLRTVFNYIGPVAQQANLSIREAAAATMVLANNGMKASTIGTALRNIFAQLSSPTAKLRTAFRESGTELGMTTEEINASLQIVSGQVEGRVVPLAERLAELNKMLGANADFLKLFGLRAGGAASILVEFPETIKQMEEDLYNVGLAHQMAEKQMEGLANTARNTIAALSGLVVVLGETWGSTLQAILKGFNDFIIGVTHFLQTDAGAFVSTFLSIATAVGGATVAVMGLTRALRSLAATSTVAGLLSALTGRGAKTASVVAGAASGAGATGLLGRIAGIGGAAVTAMGGWTGVALAGVVALLSTIIAYVKTYESASVRAYKNASIAAQEHASALGTLNVAIEAIEKRKLSDGSSASISNVLEIARQNPDYADRLLRTESNAEVLPLLREIRASRESALRASNISALQALIGAQRRASEEASAERSGRYLERITETFGEDSEEYALATRDTVSNLRKYNDALSEATGNLTSFTTSLADQWVKSDAFRSVIEKGVADSYASGKAVDPSVIMENLQGPIVDMWNSSFGSELGNITKFSDLKNIEGGKFFIEPLLSAIFAAVQGTGRKIDEGKISDFVVNRRIAQDTLNRMAAEGQYRTAVLDAAYNQGALTTIDYERKKSAEAILTATQQLEYAQKYLAEAKKLPDTDTNKSTEVARASLSVSTAETALQQAKENARLAERNALYDAQSRKIQKLTADLGGEYAVLQNRGTDYLSLLNAQYAVETRTRSASIALLDQKLAGMGTEIEMEQWRIERQNLINEGLQKEFEHRKALESFRDRDIEADVRSGRRSPADYQNYLDRQLRDNQISPSDYRYAWATRGAGADSWVNGLSAGFTRVIEQSKTFNEYMADLAVTIHDDIMQSIDDMVDSWVDGTLSMKDAFKNLSNAIAKDILKSTIKGWFNDLWTGGGGFGAEKGGVVGNNISALGFFKNLFSSNGTAASETASVEQALTDPVAESAAETVKIAQQEQVTLSSIWESIQNTASSAYNGMVQGIREFGGVATSILGSVMSVFSVFSGNSGGGFMDKLFSGVTALFGIGSLGKMALPSGGLSVPDFEATEMGTAIMTDFSKMPGLFSAKGNVFRGLQSFSNSVVDVPTVFSHAGRLPAYAKGGAFGIGVMGEAGAEAIMPLRRNSSGELVGDGSGLGGTVVNNINITPPNGYKAEESRERNENGGEDINIVFSRIVAREVSSPGSPVYRAMQNTFNTQQSLVSR